MIRPKVPSNRSQCFVKAARATINLNTDLDGAVGDARGDIAKVDIILD